MNRIYKILLALAVIASPMMMTSCDEFPPVKYDNPDPYTKYTDADFPGVTFTDIADLKAKFTGEPVEFTEDIYIKAQVVSSDQSGNLYRTMYIQDATGGIELKMGTRNLYNDYKLGQWIYVNCNGLTLGNYYGMVGLGYKSNDPEYQTAYIDNQYIIDTHIFRGELDDPVEPIVLGPEDFTKAENFGRYVQIDGLTYANAIFVILYYDPDGDHQDYANNCVFLDEEKGDNYGINTWAISENGFQKLLDDETFDFNGGLTMEEKAKFVAPYSYTVSQYFNVEGSSTQLQIRTSGYARFADTEISPEILGGTTFSAKGILSFYQKKQDDPNYQFTLIDLNGIEVK